MTAVAWSCFLFWPCCCCFGLHVECRHITSRVQKGHQSGFILLGPVQGVDSLHDLNYRYSMYSCCHGIYLGSYWIL